MPVIPVLRRLRQENCEFDVNLGNIVRLCLKKNNFSTIRLKFVFPQNSYAKAPIPNMAIFGDECLRK
jgi:hypothetical protein